MLSKGFLQTIDRIRSNDPELTSLLFLQQDFNEENGAEAFRILAEALEGNIWATNFMVNAKKDDANYQKSCEYLTRNREILKATLDCAKSTFGAKIFAAICAESPNVKAKIIEADLDRELLSFAKNNFLLRLSPAEIISFSQNWHKTLTQGLINSLKDYNGTSWPTLFQQKEFSIPPEIVGKENWKIVELTSPAELKREGDILGHCIGGYTEKCLIGGHRAFSIVDENNNPDYTFELTIDFPRKAVNLSRMAEGRDSSKRASNVLRYFEEKIRSNDAMFQIDYDKIAKFQIDCVKGGAAKLSGAAVFYLGFNPLDKKTFTKVIRAYRNEVIPQELKSRFVEFLKINEIDFKNTTLTGKRRFALEPLTKAHKPTDADEIQKRTAVNFEKQVALQKEIQDSFDKIFGANLAICVIEKKSASENYGTVVVKPLNKENGDEIAQSLNKIALFSEKIQIDENTGDILIASLNPKPVKEILAAAAAATNSLAATDPAKSQASPLQVPSQQIQID